MQWYLAKLVYRIICGTGEHSAQFDEQLRLVSASDEEQAFEKAIAFGTAEQETFFNNRQQLVTWKFINVSELYRLSELIDGAELYSRINEVDEADSYITFVNTKAVSIQQKQIHRMLNLI
ncbi:MAG: DUF4288 domain-containing protein [Flavisolibacter sp.]|jgi:hypothetical protein